MPYNDFARTAERDFQGYASVVTYGVFVGLLYGLCAGTLFRAATSAICSTLSFSCVETIKFQLGRLTLAYSARRLSYVLIIFGLAFGLLIGTMRKPGVILEMVSALLFVGLLIGSIVVPMAWLSSELIEGLSFGVVQSKSVPNEGIRRSCLHAMTIGVCATLTVSLGIFLVAGPTIRMVEGDGPLHNLMGVAQILGLGSNLEFGLGFCFLISLAKPLYLSCLAGTVLGVGIALCAGALPL